MTATLKIISLLLNALGTSRGILTFSVSFNLEKAVDCHSCLFFLSGCYFVVFGVSCSVPLCLVEVLCILVSSVTCSRLLFCLLIVFFVASIFLHFFFF